MSKNAKPGVEAGAAAKRRRGPGILTAVLMVPVLGFLLPSAIVVLSGMVPSMAAFLVDRTRGKYLTVTVALVNLCGTLPGLARLWERDQSYAAAKALAFDPFHWLASYGAAAVGWLVYLAIPPVLSAYYLRATDARIEALRREQAALVEAWGDEVAEAASEAATEA